MLHTNGFHPVTVRYCQCDRFHLAGDRVQQLLRLELYPATLTDPTTMCTFGLLNMFHLLTLISKINATDFYGTLERMTDNIGTGRSYVSLICCSQAQKSSHLPGSTQAIPTLCSRVAISQDAGTERAWLHLQRNEGDRPGGAVCSLPSLPKARIQHT